MSYKKKKVHQYSNKSPTFKIWEMILWEEQTNSKNHNLIAPEHWISLPERTESQLENRNHLIVVVILMMTVVFGINDLAFTFEEGGIESSSTIDVVRRTKEPGWREKFMAIVRTGTFWQELFLFSFYSFFDSSELFFSFSAEESK